MSGSERSEVQWIFVQRCLVDLALFRKFYPLAKQRTEYFLFIRISSCFLGFVFCWSSRFDRLYGPWKIHLADAMPSGVNEFLALESIFKHYVIQTDQWARIYEFKNTQRSTNDNHVDANIRSRYVSSQASSRRGALSFGAHYVGFWTSRWKGLSDPRWRHNRIPSLHTRERWKHFGEAGCWL